MTAAETRQRRREIPGTMVFDGQVARIGYALNRMCFSFNSADHRNAFLRDPEEYMARYGLTDTQKAAVRSREVLRMMAAGGHPYYLAKLAGIFDLDMQDLGAQQTGVTKEEFRARLAAAGA
jgi:protocatechuate 4,5-dioxygenase alpha chain